MTSRDDDDAPEGEPQQLVRVDASTMSIINRSEVEAQLDAAHRYPRVLSTFRKEAVSIACTTQDTAKSCLFTLERWDNKEKKKKYIIGPSVRLAEIVASTYRNLHVGARVVDVGETMVTCQGVAWDVQNNVRTVTEVSRRITTTNGSRFNEDLIILTQNATCAIARRNATFQAVPRALVDAIFAEVREVAAGGSKKPMEVKRKEIMDALARIGVSADRALAAVDRKTPEDLTLEDIEILIGLGSRVSQEKEPVDEVFPRTDGGPQPAEEGKRTPLRRPATATGTTTGTVAKKPEDVISTPTPTAKPTEDDEDAAAARATAPSAEEIAAREAELAAQKSSGTTTTTDKKRAPWVTK